MYALLIFSCQRYYQICERINMAFNSLKEKSFLILTLLGFIYSYFSSWEQKVYIYTTYMYTISPLSIHLFMGPVVGEDKSWNYCQPTGGQNWAPGSLAAQAMEVLELLLTCWWVMLEPRWSWACALPMVGEACIEASASPLTVKT